MIVPDMIEIRPLEVVMHGVPSLNLKAVKFTALEVPGAPTALKVILAKAPEPLNGVALKIEVEEAALCTTNPIILSLRAMKSMVTSNPHKEIQQKTVLWLYQ